MSIILDGKQLAELKRAELKMRVDQEVKKRGRAPKIAHLIGTQDPATWTYVRGKAKACAAVGIEHEIIDVSKEPLSAYLKKLNLLNQDPSFDAILPQLPLDSLNGTADGFFQILQQLNPAKDVDGLTPLNLGRLLWQKNPILPCTPAGILALLDHYKINLKGCKVVVLGRSLLVGRPLGILLDQRGATVTMVHKETINPRDLCSQADLLVAAAGSPNLVTAPWIKPGAVVIDVGINRDADGKIVGDVDARAAEKLASYHTPVPGGVGPMTITMMLHNVLELFKRTHLDQHL